MVYGADLRREWRKLVSSGEARVDNGGTGGLVSLLLSLRVVSFCDIPLVSQGQVLGQLAPMCCHFPGFLSI